MSKFKIEHGASKINLVLLKTNIEDTISNDIDLLANWSNNERRYIVNELLRFALVQEEDFQKHKANAATHTARPVNSTKPALATTKPASDSSAKPDASAAARA